MSITEVYVSNETISPIRNFFKQEGEMIEGKYKTQEQICVDAEYFFSLLEELNKRRATMSALASILESTTVTSKSIIKILRSNMNE